MSSMQGKTLSLSPDARDIPRPGNFPDLRMLMEPQTLAKAWREVKEKMLNKSMQSNSYDHLTQDELGCVVDSGAASLCEVRCMSCSHGLQPIIPPEEQRCWQQAQSPSQDVSTLQTDKEKLTSPAKQQGGGKRKLQQEEVQVHFWSPEFGLH